MRDKRAYATGATPGLAPAFVRRRPLSSTPTPEQHPSKMHRLAVRRLSVNAFPKRPGASPASDGLLSRRWRLGRRVDGVRDGPYRLDAVDAAPPPPREKENKKNTGANFIPLTPLAFIDRARHVSRVLHVFGLVPDGFVTSSTRGSARHVVAASMA